MPITAEPTQPGQSLEAPPSRDVAGDPRTDEILDIVAKETGIDRSRLLLSATIEELGIPSLDVVQTVFEFESKYDIEIPVLSDKSGSEFSTVGDLVAHVLAALDRARAA